MSSYKMKAWVGPSYVSDFSRWMKEAGIKVLIEGTEHLHIEAEGDSLSSAAENVSTALIKRHKTDFCLRFTSL